MAIVSTRPPRINLDACARLPIREHANGLREQVATVWSGCWHHSLALKLGNLGKCSALAGMPSREQSSQASEQNRGTRSPGNALPTVCITALASFPESRDLQACGAREGPRVLVRKSCKSTSNHHALSFANIVQQTGEASAVFGS